ncbi:MAG: UDP-N-acetylmuramoyl-L-alanine--D-glutamate ligase [Bacteroidales bacterium]|nr:UDP-N-acetylmuramoyl-L-alanine--D-glutamate ligase [Bacteroidales bacterium]
MNQKINTILDIIRDKKIVILGFGKEGVSSYKFIRRYFPELPLTIADKSTSLNVSDLADDKHLSVITGTEYDRHLNEFDYVMKTPGVNLNQLDYFIDPEKIISQTDLFLRAFSDQIIGVTGTKGKSTTSSLIFHILHYVTGKAILSGNIGIPFFDIIDKIEDDTVVVAELSAHQLEYLHVSPRIAILLNMYQEHLDHFNSFSNYQLAKLNITKYQKESDFLIYNADDEYIPKLLQSNGYVRNYLPFSRNEAQSTGASCLESQIVVLKNKTIVDRYDMEDCDNLPGAHNYNNIMAAVLACHQLGLSHEAILKNIQSFKGLPHRIELVGKFNDILFYNDSISTIPEAAVAAVKTLKKVDTLIVGGFDRGIEYDLLIDFLHQNPVRNVVFIGPAGKRIFDEWKEKYPLPENFILENDFEEIVIFAYKNTQPGKICLLSPAASSYDQFKNFVERGNTYKSLIENSLLRK